MPGPDGAVAPYAPQSIGASQPDPRSPSEWLLQVLWRQKFLILATVLAFCIAGILYLKWATPLYTSTTRINVQQSNLPSITPGGGSASISSQGSTQFLNTQKELITSEPVLAIAAAREDVIKTNEMERATDKSPVEHLRSIVSVEVDKTAELINVNATSTNPDDASVISTAIVKAYMLFQTKPKGSDSNPDQTLNTLDKNKSDIERDIKGGTDKLHEMEKKFGILSRVDDRSNIILNRLKTLGDALTSAQIEQAESQTEYEEAARTFIARPTTAPVDSSFDQEMPIASPQEMTMIRAEMLQVQAQLQERMQRYGSAHPTVDFYRKRLDQLNVAYLAAIRRHAMAAKGRVEELQKSFDAEQAHAAELSAQAIEYARIQADVERLKGIRDFYDARIRDIRFAREVGVVNIDEVQTAHPEKKPSFPKPAFILGIAVAMGLCLGTLLACLREWVDDRFRSASDIKTSLGMPVLALIPQSSAKRSPSVSGQRVLIDPGSDTSEAYRALRAAVQYTLPPGEMKTLLITSPSSGDGKTTLVSNLAIVMAQAGRRILVMDADLRNPSQHDIFGVKNNTGLSSLLAGRCSLETAVQRTQVPGLEILPCGPLPANPAEILNSREFGETLELLTDKYDCVVVDSPPVEAVSDARIIAASCDATLIVLKAQTAHRRTTEHTRDALLSVGARIIGLVVNDIPRRSPADKYTAGSSGSRRYVKGLTNEEGAELVGAAKK